MADERIWLSPPCMGDEEQQYIQQAFASNWIAPLGPNVDIFEERVASYVGVKHALAVNSGTAAIHLALRVLGVNTGDVVFCSSLTFVASANPILYQGATPVFIDSDESWNMSPNALEKALSEYQQQGQLPKAVIVVNIYGQSAKYDQILAICSKYKVPVIEDAAESLGSSFQNKKSASFGRLSIVSFNGNKMITTSGGGMLLSNSKELIDTARFLSTQAKEPKPYYHHKTTGYNYRLSNVLAGIGLGQFEKLDMFVSKRRENFFRYVNELKDVSSIGWLKELNESICNRWLSVMLLDRKASTKPADIIETLAKNNIEARHVWKPLHCQPLFATCSFYRDDEKCYSEEYFSQGICLPSGASLTKSQQERVIDIIKHVVA